MASGSGDEQEWPPWLQHPALQQLQGMFGGNDEVYHTPLRGNLMAVWERCWSGNHMGQVGYHAWQMYALMAAGLVIDSCGQVAEVNSST